MYPVSAAYKTAIQQSVRDVRITGTITLKDSSVINIADADIVQGSLYITEQCVSGEDIEVGNVYAAEMGLALTAPMEDPYALDGARILLNFGLKVGAVWEDVPLGYFYVTEIERKLLNVKLTALDGMLLFDVPCGNPGPGTPAGFVAHACSVAGVTLANAVEVSTFANAALGFGEPDEKVKTCRDLVMWACQLMGAFARMDRQGQLEIVPITMRASVKDIDKATRFKSDVSDFGVKITQIAMTVGETEYSRGTPGMTMALEENPMMVGLDASVVNTALDNIRSQVTKAVYVPFNSDFIGDPALQPGDYITLKDAGILDSETETIFFSENSPLEVQQNFVVSMITHSTWRYRGAHNIKAVGKSAIIRGVQQQQAKALSAISVLAKMAQDIALATNQSTQLIKDAMGGHVLIRQSPDETNEILIMDNPDPELATKIWRWNMGGLGYSDNCEGVDNPDREYEVAMTMDGVINGNFIRAGVIAAEHIQIGQATTFEEGYDPSKTHPIGMGADSDCTGLWHFDGSLNSHKGIAAIFDGVFVPSLWGQGLNVAAGKTLKIPTDDILDPGESSINFRTYNLATSPNGAVLLDIGDLQYGEDFTADKVYSADSNLQSNTPDKAFDGDPINAFWHSTYTSMPHWIKVDVGVGGKKARKLRIYVIPGQLSPKNFKLQGSNDNTAWSDVYTGILPNSQGWHEFIFSNSRNYRYYRLYITTNHNNTGEYSGTNGATYIQEMELIEAAIGNQAIKAGIANDGKLFIEDNKVEFVKAETSQADFNTGTLTDVISNPTGDLTLGASGSNFTATEDTQVEFEAGTLANTEYASGLKLKYTPGESGYGADFTDGGTYSADSVNSSNTANRAFDNNPGTRWISGSTFPHWVQVDLGVGVSKKVRKLRLRGYWYNNNFLAVKNFILQGSNNGSGFTNIYSGVTENKSGWQEFAFENANSYRYNRLHITSTYISGDTGTAVDEIELMELVETEGTYALSGTWEKVYDLSAVGVARSSTINWGETVPVNTAIQVQAAIALDGVNYGSYSNCTSGYVIPGITAGMDLSSAKMKIKVTLTTTDTSVTPSLNSLTLWVTSAYKTSGYRVHIYDISGVGIAELSQITWDATLPTGTSVAVKAAISTDGGSSYGAFQTCTSGQAIPVLTANMDISNARLKIQGNLATSDYSATPKLNSLDISVSKAANIAYGTNKSELTDWDDIAIQWKTERLSLLANGVEIAYIENPGLVTVFGDYAYIGCDKLGANQIGTTIDELRVDKVYQPIDKVLAWCIVNAPFYTSEEFAQWPGYIRTETDGLKVYDSEGNLRVLLGSWMEGLLREYGLEVIKGKIYSSLIRSGGKEATAYIQFSPPNRLEVFGNSSAGTNLKMLEIGAPDDISEGKGGQMDFYLDGNFMGVVAQQADAFWILNALPIKMSSLQVTGSKNCIEYTENYGTVALAARESPETRYIDEGMGALVNGECRIDVDPIFMECIEPNTEHSRWYIDLTPYGKAHIYLDEIGDSFFIVKDWDGTANIRFKWTLSATRKNYAHIRFQEVV